MKSIRPVRQIKRYEEHIDFYRYSLLPKVCRRKSGESEQPEPEFSFPYAKEAEIHSAEQFARAVAAMLGAAAHIKQLLEQLNGTAESSVLKRRTVRSSRPEAVLASAEPGADTGAVTVAVRRLAVSQLNRTAYFTPDAPTNLAVGFNRIRLASGKQTAVIECLVLAGDTHKTVLNRLRNQWRAAVQGIKATLENDSSTGRIRLALESVESGADAAFQLEDITGNAASATGLLVLDRAAADAEYKLDDEEWTVSPVNRISIAKRRLSLELKEAASEPVILDIMPDIPLMEHSLRELAQAVRKLEAELEHSAEFINPDFARSLSSIGELASADALADQLQDRLSDTLDELTKEDGLIARLLRLIARMEAGPAEELLNRSNTRYKRYANYLASLGWYSQLPSQGLLLNRFF